MKTRIISGAVGIAILAAVLWLHTTFVFPLGLFLVGFLMVYEMLGALKMKTDYVLIAAASLHVLAAAFSPRLDLLESGVLGGAALYIAAIFAYIVISQFYLLFRHKQLEIGSYYIGLAYCLLIGFCMYSISKIEAGNGTVGVLKLILAFMGAWVADSGAYFAGTFLGKHKLCPEISPKKTVEGLIGGMAANAVVFFAYALIAGRFFDFISPLPAALIGVICALLGLLGDLSASLIKRHAGIKDYGKIMPGHGGAMDRFDSMVYIAPFMMFAFGGLA